MGDDFVTNGAHILRKNLKLIPVALQRHAQAVRKLLMIGHHLLPVMLLSWRAEQFTPVEVAVLKAVGIKGRPRLSRKPLPPFLPASAIECEVHQEPRA
jgi:hypothetical protein